LYSPSLKDQSSGRSALHRSCPLAIAAHFAYPQRLSLAFLRPPSRKVGSNPSPRTFEPIVLLMTERDRPCPTELTLYLPFSICRTGAPAALNFFAMRGKEAKPDRQCFANFLCRFLASCRFNPLEADRATPRALTNRD